MPSVARNDRLVKDGWCRQCSRSDVPVSWHPGSRAWYCTDCWPRLTEKSQQEERRESRLPTAAQLAHSCDLLYGFRLEDSPSHPGCFIAICPEHGVLADELTLADARAGLSAHVVDVH